MNSTDKLNHLQDLLLCCDNVYLWKYNPDGELIQSNCPNESILNTAFQLLGCCQRIISHGRKHHMPITIGSVIGLVWYAVFDKDDDNLRYIYVIGPIRYYDIPIDKMKIAFQKMLTENISIKWSVSFFKIVDSIPIIQNTIMMRYVLMLHFCVTNEQIEISDLNTEAEITSYSLTSPEHYYSQVWAAERNMLAMIRNGDLNYKYALSECMRLSNGVPVGSQFPAQQSQISVIVFITLVCRAAIEGGLSPEEAYTLGNSYIHSVLSIKDTTDFGPIALLMYEDFVQRVHKRHANPKYSTQIQKCCDYIEMHMDKKIQAKDLAKLAGYSEYYLTHKFKQETGYSLNSFIRSVKIERAKILLRYSELSLQEISEQLCFGNRSYFGTAFQKMVGCTPMQYREAKDELI
ncbi:helix-turn-helix transcriptional regulator [Eisenbergiella sp.]